MSGKDGIQVLVHRTDTCVLSPHTHICTHVHTRAHTHAHTRMHTRTRVCSHTHMRVLTHTHTHTVSSPSAISCHQMTHLRPAAGPGGRVHFAAPRAWLEELPETARLMNWPGFSPRRREHCQLGAGPGTKQPPWGGEGHREQPLNQEQRPPQNLS